jgi:hypothetical protein
VNNENREHRMVVIERDDAGTPTVWCDPEIVDLVTSLNAGGVRTIASCSGHGYRPGWIALADGRQLVIAPDLDACKKIDALFPVDINGGEFAALSPAPSAGVGDAVKSLREIRDLIASRPLECLGIGQDSDRRAWPIRDEVTHNLDRIIAALQHPAAPSVSPAVAGDGLRQLVDDLWNGGAEEEPASEPIKSSFPPPGRTRMEPG